MLILKKTNKFVLLTLVFCLLFGSSTAQVNAAGSCSLTLSSNQAVVAPSLYYELPFTFRGHGISKITISSSTSVSAELSKLNLKGGSGTVKFFLKAGKTGGSIAIQLLDSRDRKLLSKTLPVKAQPLVRLYVNHSKGLNVRSKASTDSSILAILSYKKKVEAYLATDGWYYLPNYKGYCSSQYLTKINNSSVKSGFDGQKAVKIARQKVGKISGDCAGFVSYVLKESGANISKTASCNNLYKQLKNSGQGKFQKLKVEANGTILFSKNPQLKAGSPLLLYCGLCEKEDGLPYGHAVIFSGDTDGSGRIRVYAQNRLYKNSTYYGFNYCSYYGHGKNSTTSVYAYIFK